MDETACHSFMSTKKSWSLAYRAVEVPINTTRMSITLIASIGNCLEGGFCLTQARSTNREDVLKHLKQVKGSLRDKTVKPWICLDNATAHHAKEVAAYLEQNFRVLWLPAYTPIFNSCESIWGTIKPKVKKTLVTAH